MENGVKLQDKAFALEGTLIGGGKKKRRKDGT